MTGWVDRGDLEAIKWVDKGGDLEAIKSVDRGGDLEVRKYQLGRYGTGLEAGPHFYN